MTVRVFILVAALAAVSCATAHRHPECNLVRWNDNFISRKWLQRKTSIEAVEARDRQTGWPFNHQPNASADWVRLKNDARQGDELWELNTPSQYGYALVRGCDIVAVVFLIES